VLYTSFIHNSWLPCGPLVLKPEKCGTKKLDAFLSLLKPGDNKTREGEKAGETNAEKHEH